MQRIKAMGIVVTKLPNGLPLLYMNSSHVSVYYFFISCHSLFVMLISIICIVLGK